ncbi:MAG TPA: hypothetical protein VF623_14125, partial [Segetibacter sp.]
ALFNVYQKVYNNLSTKIKKMDFKTTLANKLNLKDDASEDEIIEAIDNLNKTSNDIQSSAVSELVEGAVRDRKITFSQKGFYENAAKYDFEGTKNLISSMSPILKPTEMINRDYRTKNKTSIVDVSNKDRSQWDLNDWRKNAPGELRNNPDLYNSLLEKEK